MQGMTAECRKVYEKAMHEKKQSSRESSLMKARG